MTQLGYDALELKSLLRPMVALIVEKTCPKKDLISMNQAYNDFGRRWVDKMIREGNITTIDRDTRVYLSNAELECLWAAQKRIPSIITK